MPEVTPHKCSLCGVTMLEKVGAHHYTGCGLTNVMLKNVSIRACSKCGEDEVVIRCIEKIHRKIAFMVALQTKRLHGGEIRFLRSYLGLSSVLFSSIMGAHYLILANPRNMNRYR